MSLQFETADTSGFTAHQAMPATRPIMSPVPPNYTTSPIVYDSTENAAPPTSLRGLATQQPQAPLSYLSTTNVKYSIEGPIVSEVARDIETQNRGESSAPMDTEINRILARIEQDNRILAELEKSRATVDLPLLPVSSDTPRGEMSIRERNLSLPSKQSVSRQELEQLMAKLEQDNRILAELDKKRNILETLSSKSSSFLAGHLPIMPSPSPSLGSLRDPSASLALQGLTASASSASLHHALVPAGHTLIPTALLQRLAPAEAGLTEEEMLDSIDFIELPGRGRCNIYCARYTYDPLKQSPNENPEAELALNAGDYVIIYGEMDEDGFFNGELLDGRKGLVPSNFVEKLTGEELFEFHATVLYGNRDSDDSSVSFSYAQDMEMTVSDDLLHPDDFHRMNDYVDLEDIEDMDKDNEDNEVVKDDENFERGVPPPQRLILERQMNKSLLIGWVPPDVKPGKIEGYHVYVDGVPKATIKFSERTRALIEGVDSSRPHRISVRSISNTGLHSKDAACTIVVGKDFPLAPTCVKASHITASSALISWLPSNSNFQHVIAVNSVEVKVVKPGCFRHLVTGLSPNTLYRVSVRVKPGKLLYNDEKNPKKLEMLVSNVEFRTLPKGLPDPPVNVQVEQGPQDGTLLVTWMPVITSSVSTSIAPVIGYGVFAAGRQIAEVESPTGDHALIDGSQLLAMNKKCITVKSKSSEGFSSDSQICVVPNELLRSMQKSVILRGRMFDERTPRERRSSSSDSESDTELTELLNHVNRRARAFDPLDSPFSSSKGDVLEELQIEGRSELSDIVEEEEETSMDAGENKSRMLCKVESISEADGMKADEVEKHRTDTQEYQSKPLHTVRRPNQNLLASQVPNQRRQDWKDQSYNSRSMLAEDDNGIMDSRSRREHRNSSGQIVLDPEENLSDKEIYPPSRANIPLIAVKDGHHNYKITKDGTREGDCDPAYSDDEYIPRQPLNQRPSSPERYAPSSSQQRPLRTEPDAHHTSNSRSNRGPQSHYSQQHPHRERSSPRRQPHDSTITRSQPTPSNQIVTGRQRVPPQPDQNRRSSRNNSQAHVSSRSSSQPPPPERGADHSYYSERRSGKSGSNVPPPSSRRMSDYHEPTSGYEDQGNYDSYRSHGDVGDNRVRYFVALFDYDPQTMSPNPDAADEELPFQEGQIIKIYGDKDPDGFYRGESNGRVGLVPGNMVSEVQVDVDLGHYNDNVSRPRSLGHMELDERDNDFQSRRIKKMVAIYDYDPQEISPNVDSEVELSFNTGDIIYVIGDVDEDGFYMGELKGVKGLVPSNFLREVPLDEEDKRPIGSRPKGQGRSYLGRADCQWNGQPERTTNTLKMQRRQWDMEEFPRNHITYAMLNMRELESPQIMHHPPHYGRNGISKEKQHFEDHIYPLEDKECPTHKHFQDPPQLRNIGNRPTYLHLQAGIRNYSSDQRRRSAPDIQIQVDSPLKDSRKGIFSSFKDMFKGPKRN
ncbi:RIMS-binding protein 2-like isoform X1 [Argiope bruennichi]|uniref:RIMS-binding protein 2-like isoform X1 n=1 Tax=Argiope bruennichi TaxID=94029 RepID=UPI002494CC0D|nr:RIMS-binding protein 2-like isoform X1 [Argiope bruennichi]